jgi:hypothetical protein
MPQFISKLQHNTHEKGEFSDEAPRDLEETIQLIKTFPWDLERPLTDIQLTGPSVTIIDDDLNYLKLGLYFGGKFCLYYLDRDNHLYEYHAPDIDDASRLVNDFFNKCLDLAPFDKHFFNIGNQPHFVTSYFEYRLKKSRIAFMIAISMIYPALIIASAFGVSKGDHSLIPVVIPFWVLGCFVFYILFKVFQLRHQYLQISRGNNQFSFGQNEDSINTYYKNDIKELIVFEGGSPNRSNIMQTFEIAFKNEERIRLTGILIQRYDFLSKFPEKLGIPVIYQRNNLFKNR